MAVRKAQEGRDEDINHTKEVTTVAKGIGIGLGLVVLTLAARPGSAQQHQHDSAAAKTAPQTEMTNCSMMTAMMGRSDGAMVPWMQFTADHVLKNADVLELSADQVSRIQAMRRSGSASHGMPDMAARDMPMKEMPMMTGMPAAHQDLRMAFERTPADPAAIRTAMGEIAALHGAMMAEHLVAAAQVRDVLTPAQRERVAKMPVSCGENGMGMMQRGKPDDGTPGVRHHTPPAA